VGLEKGNQPDVSYLSIEEFSIQWLNNGGLEITEFDIISKEIESKYYENFCENNTLTLVASNHIEIKDNHNNIHLTKMPASSHVELQQPSIETGTP